MIKRFVLRWLFSISRELIIEAKEAQNAGFDQSASVLIGIAAALNRADGEIR